MTQKENKEVIIYTSDNCGACTTVKMYLDQNDVTYEERNVTQNDAAMTELTELGYQSTPVTVGTDVEPFAGFELNELETLVQTYHQK